MYCPECGTPNPSQARFCMGCGRLLVAGKVCPQCATLLPSEARFCIHCGTYQAQAIGAAERPHETPALLNRAANEGAAEAPRQPVEKPSTMAHAADAPSEQVTKSRADIALPSPRPLADMLASLHTYLPDGLYEPLERRPKPRDLEAVRDHLGALLGTITTYLPAPVVLAPQPPGEPAGGMVQGAFLFGDVSGFTPLSEKLKALGQEGAERITEIINQLFAQLVNVLFDYGGTLLKFGGDALLGHFPATSETELVAGTLKAVQAAMAMQEVLQQESFAAIDALGETQSLKIKCGISAGAYFEAHIGTPARPDIGRRSKMAYITTGHTVNIAEEAEGHANPGEVVISRDAYQRIASSVDVAPVTKSPDEDFVRIMEAPSAPVQERQKSGSRPQLGDLPEGDPLAQITYLVDRLDHLAAYLSDELIARISLNPADARIAPDHRPVTVMFVNYVGISDLIEDMGESHPEIIVQQLNAYFNHMAEIVEKYEGSLARMDQYAVGDRLVIFFGAPRAHEDDPLRAVYSALEMQAATREAFAALQTPFGIYRFRQRVGINTGTLFAGNAGAPDLRQEYTLMGDDINMAARLMSYAAWDDIYISDKTATFVAPYLQLSNRFDLQVKGKSILIPTYRVLGSRREGGQTRGLAGVEPLLVGRDAALATLKSCGKRWLNGRGQIVAVVGESGLGKTRLLRAYRDWLTHQQDVADAEGIEWIEARALSFSEQMNYWLAQEILRSLLHLPADVKDDDLLYELWEKSEALTGKEKAREIVPFLAHMMGLSLEGEWAEVVTELSPKARQKEILWATRELFRAAADVSSLVIALDDLHWADEATLTLLTDLLSIADEAPIMLLLAFRIRRDKACWELRNRAASDFPHRYSEVQLAPLTDPQSRKLLAHLLPGAVFEDATYEEIFTKAAGNPLYLEELVRSLIETGAVVQDLPERDYLGELVSWAKDEADETEQPVRWRVTAEIDNITVPSNLRAAVVARIDRLTEDARYALQRASVIGRQFRRELLRNLVEAESEIDHWLGQLERSEFIRSEEIAADPTYAFADTLVYEVAYDSLLVQSRAQLHARIGEALETMFADGPEQGCELLAYHFSRSDDHDRALRYLQMAADKARGQYANETAIQHYEKMLEFQREREDKAKEANTLYNLGVLAYEIGDYGRARPWLAEAVERFNKLNDPANKGWSVMYLGMVDLKQGRYTQALDHHTQALELAREREDTVQEGIHLTNVARALMRLGRYAQALDLFDASLALKRRNNDLTGQGFALFYQSLVYLDLEQLAEAETTLQGALDAWEQVPHNNRVMSYYEHGAGQLALAHGDGAAAIDHLRKALDMSRRLALNAEVIENLSSLGQAYLCTSDVEAAVASSTEAVNLLERQKDVEEIHRIYFQHYLVLKAAERPEAKSFLHRARAVMTDRAARIADESKRRSFLENVKINEMIAHHLDEASGS